MTSSSTRARLSRTAANKLGARPAVGKAAAKAPASKAAGGKTAAARMSASKSAVGKSAASKAVKSAGAQVGKPASKAAGAKPASKAPSKHGPRADFGAPIDGFFRRQPAPLRPILEELRTLIKEVAPDAISSIKWGMPFFSIGDAMMCALGGHKSHVNLILSGPPGTYADPEGRLSGEGKTGRHLKLTSLDEIPRASVRGWLRTAAELARR
jgi:hypothetical protein